MAPVLLNDLAQRIGEQEVQLQALRRELETRQHQLAELNQRKSQLLTQLQQIDTQIAAVASGRQPVESKASRTPSTGPTRTALIRKHVGNATATKRKPNKPFSKGTPSQAKGAAGPGADQPSLPALIITMLREARQPLTVPQLAQEAKRRGFRSNSSQFAKVVETRVYDLKRKGLLRHAVGRPGFTLTQGKAAGGVQPQSPKDTAGKTKSAPSGERKGAAQRGQLGSVAGRPASGTKVGKGVPLTSVLTAILRKSGKPLTGSELARRALKAGYRSTSKSFVDVVRAGIGAMENVEHVANQGYRLKQLKA